MKILINCLSFLLVSPAFAAMLPDFREARAILEVTVDHFTTTENYISDGSKQPLGGDLAFNTTAVNFVGTYIFPMAISTSLGLQYARSESTGIIEDRTNAELNEFFLRGRKLFAVGSFRMVPEVVTAFATNEIDEFQDQTTTSDGVNRYQIGGHLSYSAMKLRLYAYGGYMIRTEGHSDLLPWHLGAGLRTRPVALTFELGGYRSISDDDYTDTPFRRDDLTDLVNAGSRRFYSINPDLTEVRGHVTYELPAGLALTGGVAQTLAGTNTAHGQTYTVGLSWFTDTFAPTKSSGAKSTREGKAKKSDILDDKFEEALEEYDESLFENE